MQQEVRRRLTDVHGCEAVNGDKVTRVIAIRATPTLPRRLISELVSDWHVAAVLRWHHDLVDEEDLDLHLHLYDHTNQ